jgi:glycosyltransferase involved in cell wall biosynthesis
MVSVCCLSYNHEDYIRQCLDSIVTQQTSFAFEVLVHDDASTDKSQQIIREYQQRYPDIIKPILQTENQYRKGKGILGIHVFPKCSGKYLAFCECDDYWTDPNKLQRQVDFMESHPEYVATADNGMVVNSVIHQEFPFNTDPSHDISLEEAIIKRRFPTAGVLCLREAMNGYSETCRVSVDTIQWCWLISKGKFRYENIISSVYRKGEQGMTIYTKPLDLAKKVEQWNLEILRVYNVKKDFIYGHIAQSFYDFVKSSIRHHHIGSAFKCLFYCFVYEMKSLWSKIC